jgi:hypothetical protein
MTFTRWLVWCVAGGVIVGVVQRAFGLAAAAVGRG